MFKCSVSGIPHMQTSKTLIIGCGRTNHDEDDDGANRRLHRLFHPHRTAITVDIDAAQSPDVVGNVTERLPFLNNSFECIFMENIDSTVFTDNEYEAAEKTISECARLLKPNGVLKILVGKEYYDTDEGDFQEWEFNWLINELLPACGFVRTRVTKGAISGFSDINETLIEHYKNRVDLESGEASRPGLGMSSLYSRFQTTNFEAIHIGLSIVAYKL